jgi:hypothetical protein
LLHSETLSQKTKQSKATQTKPQIN